MCASVNPAPDAEPLCVFIERSRLGRTFFEVRDGHVHVSGRRLLNKIDLLLPLAALAPQTERLKIRFWRPMITGVSSGGALLGVAAALYFQSFLPHEAVAWFIHIFAVSGAGLLGYGLQWVPPLEVVRFADRSDNTAFFVAREFSRRAEVDAFVTRLQQSIAKVPK